MTLEEDVFAMAACLTQPVIRLHRINSMTIFDKKNLSYCTYFRSIMPQFHFIVGGEHLQKKLKTQYNQSSINLPPVTDFNHYRPKNPKRKYITMINSASSQKGLILFLNIAKNMPHKHFLIRSSLSVKELLIENTIRNVTIVPWVKDMNTLYDKTRILIMPCLEESYGRVILEALAHGIPVIATETVFKQQTLNNSILTVKINHEMSHKPDYYYQISYHLAAISEFIKLITLLDDPIIYKKEAKKAHLAAKKARQEDATLYKNFIKWLNNI